MSGYSSNASLRRGANLNVSQFLVNGNTITSPTDPAAAESELDFNFDDDLARFTNVDFADFDSHTFFDTSIEAASVAESHNFQSNKSKKIKAESTPLSSADMIYLDNGYNYPVQTAVVAAPSSNYLTNLSSNTARPASTGIPDPFSFVPTGQFVANFDSLPLPVEPQSPSSIPTLERSRVTSQVSLSSAAVSAETAVTGQKRFASSTTTPASHIYSDNVDAEANEDELLDADGNARMAADEDKRRRNTAASARFRIKKKQREQALEKTAEELKARAQELEAKVTQLQTENEWLRGLVVVKQGANVNTLPISPPTSSSSTERGATDPISS